MDAVVQSTIKVGDKGDGGGGGGTGHTEPDVGPEGGGRDGQ